MAETVTEYNVTVSAGVLTLSGAGHYNVTIEGTAPDEITSLTGVSRMDMIDLRPATSADLFILRHNGENGINLQEGFDFETLGVRDSITLRGMADDVVEEFGRRRIPAS